MATRTVAMNEPFSLSLLFCSVILTSALESDLSGDSLTGDLIGSILTIDLSFDN